MIIRRMTWCGALLLASILVPETAVGQDVAAGERLFRQRCGACHTVQSGQNRMGPHLAGIIGHKAGSVDGARYSQGMRDLAVTWDAAQLNSFLANPRAVVPGTTMTVSVPSEADRTNIVTYLQGLAPTTN
jgi:cytochrome c